MADAPKGKFRKTKLVLVREPNGRASRTAMLKEYPPTQVKRLRDAALAGMADPEWGTVCGQLFLRGDIGASQYSAAKRWAERAAKYHHAMNSPSPNPKALDLDRRAASVPPDPASEEGQKLTRRDIEAVTEFRVAHAVLMGAGKLSEAMVRAACEQNDSPVGVLEREALNRGLLWLADHWNLTKPGKS